MLGKEQCKFTRNLVLLYALTDKRGESKCSQGRTRKDVEEYISFESAAHGISVENEEVRSESIVSD